jgi:hypothetical protein
MLPFTRRTDVSKSNALPEMGEHWVEEVFKMVDG